MKEQLIKQIRPSGNVPEGSYVIRDFEQWVVTLTLPGGWTKQYIMDGFDILPQLVMPISELSLTGEFHDKTPQAQAPSFKNAVFLLDYDTINRQRRQAIYNFLRLQ